jgi:hypothetical protein
MPTTLKDMLTAARAAIVAHTLLTIAIIRSGKVAGLVVIHTRP